MSRKKTSPRPSERCECGDLHPAPPHSSPHSLILRGVFGLVALARRVFQRRFQSQLLGPTRRFHEVSGARRHSVPKLRKLSVGFSATENRCSAVQGLTNSSESK